MNNQLIPTPPSIGRNVKKERLHQQLSLDALASLSGVSKAMLSQVESNKVNPTIATVWKIAHALKVDFNAMLKGDGDKVRKFDINRKEDIRVLNNVGEGVKIQVLSPITMAEELELYLLDFEPGAALHSKAHYAGAEEYLTVIEGSVDVTADKNSARLNSGDLLLYQCDTEHSIINCGTVPARIYLVVRFPHTAK